MAFIRDLFKRFKVNDPKTKKSYSYLNKSDPMETWDVTGEIGDGAFGKVFKAKNKSTDDIAALKQVNLEEEGDLEEYIVEIEILTECKHANVVNLYNAYHFESKLWMALEYCNGGALDSLMITLDKNLNEKAIKYTSKEILSGLIFLHSNGVIHRDMKAGNVLVSKDADVKLADFGVSAKLAADKQKRNTVQGTPYWMAPEVIACQNMESYYDCRADIWSFGITLMELAQMRPPYHQMQPTRVLIKIAKADPPTLDRPNLWSSAFVSFLKRCLTKKPEDRPYGPDLLSDPFVVSCTESDKRSLKLLIYEAKAENIEEVVEDLDLKDVRHSLMPSQTFDDISEQDDTSLGSSDILETPNAIDTSSKSIFTTEILDNLINEQIKSEADKVSILGVVVDIMENNPCTNIDETIAQLEDQNKFDRRRSIRMAMDQVPDMPVSETKDNESVEKFSIKDEDSDKESNAQAILNRKKSFYKTMTKTRKFVVDGEEITTTTTKVVREGLENKNRDQIQDRKMEIRELQLLAKEESREKRQLQFKMLAERDSLISRQKSEELAFEKNNETEMDNLNRSHKAKLERLENQNYEELTNYQKRLLSDKAKKENDFKNKEKTELNKELDRLPKNQKRENGKKLRDNHNIIFQEKFKTFQDQLLKDIEEKIESMTANHRFKICELELALMKEKHQKLSKYNAVKANLEMDHCQSSYQLENQQKKEMFMLGKSQVKHRQEKEIEHLEKNNKKELEELDYIQQNEKKTFPRFIKNTSRTRNIQKKAELEIQLQRNLISSSEMKAKLKEFEESEKEREKADSKRMNNKLIKKREAMLTEHFQRRQEFEQIHAEQKNELSNQETAFLREIEKRHKNDTYELAKKAENKKLFSEQEFKLQEEKLKSFYNTSEKSYGNITPYSSKIINEKKVVEALC